jgi:glycosyltransferase involved in cell wall biosynthesis
MKSFAWFNVALEQSGGGERLSLEVVKSLRELGYKASYITYSYDSMATFDHQYDYLNPVAMGVKLQKDTNAFKGIIGRIKRIIWLRRQLMDSKPDCVITSGTWGPVVDVYIATLFTNIEYVTHVFGSMFAFTPDKESLKYGKIFQKNFNEVRLSLKSYQEVVPPTPPHSSILKRFHRELSSYVKYRAIRASKALFVLSERNRWENQKLYGRDSHVLQGAFPAHIFDYMPRRSLKQDLAITESKVILSIGRLAANKRVDLAIRAFAELAPCHAQARLVIGGTGPESAKLKQLVQELALSDKVHFIGYVPEAILWDYLADCDAFLHLDIADFDIAPLEALAMGVNVVWGNEMDLPDLAEQLSCLWSVAPEPAIIAHATIQAIQAGKKSMRPEARRHILEPYSWESYTSRMVRCIEVTKIVDQ